MGRVNLQNLRSRPFDLSAMRDSDEDRRLHHRARRHSSYFGPPQTQSLATKSSSRDDAQPPLNTKRLPRQGNTLPLSDNRFVPVPACVPDPDQRMSNRHGAIWHHHPSPSAVCPKTVARPLRGAVFRWRFVAVRRVRAKRHGGVRSRCAPTRPRRSTSPHRVSVISIRRG